MSVLLISCNLRSKTKDYTPFYNAIRNHTGTWWHYNDIWMVQSNSTADAFAKSLYPFIENSDHLLVIKVAKEYQGWLPEEAWKWLNNRQYD